MLRVGDEYSGSSSKTLYGERLPFPLRRGGQLVTGPAHELFFRHAVASVTVHEPQPVHDFVQRIDRTRRDHADLWLTLARFR